MDAVDKVRVHEPVHQPDHAAVTENIERRHCIRCFYNTLWMEMSIPFNQSISEAR